MTYINVYFCLKKTFQIYTSLGENISNINFFSGNNHFRYILPLIHCTFETIKGIYAHRHTVSQSYYVYSLMWCFHWDWMQTFWVALMVKTRIWWDYPRWRRIPHLEPTSTFIPFLKTAKWDGKESDHYGVISECDHLPQVIQNTCLRYGTEVHTETALSRKNNMSLLTFYRVGWT